MDEVLPLAREAFDCDGDDWTGNQENLLYNDAPSTARDQDPCGGYSGAPSANDGWLADLTGDNKLNIGDFNSFIFLRTGDNVDAHGPFSYFGHTLDDDGDTVIETAEAPNSNGGPDDPPTYNVARWNIDVQPLITPATQINIGDLIALNPAVNAPTSHPPMFCGQAGFLHKRWGVPVATVNAGSTPVTPDELSDHLRYWIAGIDKPDS